MNKNHWYLIVSISLLILTLPYFFTQLYTGISFNDTGGIGDTIGGITAPFINIGAAILVYLSFKEQIKANYLLSKESSYNYINNLFNNGFQTNDIDALKDDLVKSIKKHLTAVEHNTDSLQQIYLAKLIRTIKYYRTVFIELESSNLNQNIKNNFNYLFLNNVELYIIISSDLNNYYTNSGNMFEKQTIKKYNELENEINELIKTYKKYN